MAIGSPDYTEPKPDRYHAGLKAGQLSQPGIILTMLLRSVVENRRLHGKRFLPAPRRRTLPTPRRNSDERAGWLH